MLWLEDIESEDNLTVVKFHITEWAKEVCTQIDNLDKRLKTVEGVMEDGHHKPPIITVGDPVAVVNLPPLLPPAGAKEERFLHNPDYGVPGSWGDAYAGVCALYVAARQENERLRERLTKRVTALEGQEEHSCPNETSAAARIAEQMERCYQRHNLTVPGQLGVPMTEEGRQIREDLRATLYASRGKLRIENARLRVENKTLRAALGEGE